MNFLPWSETKASDIVAIIDLGSSRVGGALWQIENKNNHSQSRLLAEQKEEIFFPETMDQERFLKETTAALVKVLTGLTQKQAVSSVICFLSQPFFLSQTRVIHYKNPAGFKVTRKLVDNLVSAEAAKFQNQAKLKLLEAKDDQIELIENFLMQVKLNGYEIAKPYGQKTEILQLSQHLSAAPLSLLNQLRQTIKETTKVSHVIFHSFAFAAFTTLRDMIKEEKSFIFIDVSGELTDIIALRQGVLVETASFPIGRNTLVRKMAENLGTSFQEALSTLRLYQADQANSQLANRVNFSLNQVKTDWLENFKKVIEVITESTFLPETIYLIGDEPSDQFFLDFIKGENLQAYTLSTKNFTVAYLEQSLIGKKLLGEKPITNTFLLVEALFCDKLYAKA